MIPALFGLLDPRRSFAGKLLAALLGTLAIVLAVAFTAVRGETAVQVEQAATRAATVADTTFRSIEGVQRARLAEVAGRVAGGRRAVASLEAAMESGEVEPLIADVDYDLELSQLKPEQVLVVLTDPEGVTVVARAAGRMLDGDDPASVKSLVDRMYDEGQPEVRAYRVVDGRLYNLHAAFLELAGRPVGTFSLGLPMGDDEAKLLGGVVGAEVCFVADGRCVAGTAGARGDLGAEMVAGAYESGPRRIEDQGGRWSVSATALDPTDESIGRRVIAVPLDPVLEPFDRISRTLALAGLFALVLSALLGAALARGLTRPVRSLVAATERVAHGDYDAEVSVGSRDEIGALAAAFNQMTHGLRLKERYRGVLNKVVSPEVAEELMKGAVELGGENRDVTVIFADVRGFTALTEGMEPQAVIKLLNECMGILSKVVDDEGGVVDKYVGDQIMAVFGAPVRTPDHAARGVRAAVRMREEIGRMNADRLGRGETAVRIGVGVNSGVAVAGNMGSPERLNYTVLGETVNLASRLCSAAAVDQVLASGATVRAAGVPAVSLGGRALKGFTGDVEVFAVEDGARSAPRLGIVVGLAVALLCLGFGNVSAQVGDGGLPTLEGLGLRWASPSGAYQGELSGRLDLELYVPQDAAPGLIPDSSPFAAGRMRLFGDVFAGDHVYGSAELRVDRGETPTAGSLDVRMDQAFVRIAPSGSHFQLQLGKFASPFGGYAARHHTVSDVFIRPPLPYDVHTVISWNVAPQNAAGFLTWRDRPAEFRSVGAPPIWNVPYQWGAMALLAAGKVDARIGWMNSLPSSIPPSWGWNGGSVANGAPAVSVGWTASPELRLGGSWTRGPYLWPLIRGSLPTGAKASDYYQQLVGVEGVFSRGPAVLRSEVVYDWWKVPNVADNATDVSGYLEAQTDVVAGLWIAARVAAIHYRDVANGLGGAAPWDYDVRRAQLSAGYRLVRNAELKVEVMHTEMDGPLDPRDDLFSVQLWWAY